VRERNTCNEEEGRVIDRREREEVRNGDEFYGGRDDFLLFAFFISQRGGLSG
jgi:hypothetical protein